MIKFHYTIYTAILICITLSSKAQDLYDINTIQSINITFAESNWDQLLDNAYDSGEYILAQQVAVNGVVYDSVGVKYKGNSTYRASQVKNPWHIELDTYKDQDHQGYTDIKLSNVAKDPSFIREVLSYQILRQYMDGPLSNYANVTVNDQLIGLYSNSEAISKKFIKNRFGSKNNTFVKCNPIGGAGPQASDFPDLQYLGQDSTAYYDGYELKSDYGWQDLIDFCDTLSNVTDEVSKVLDVDRALWMLAYNNALVNLDSYSGGFKQNYYLYQDDFGRFLSVVWDLNESFGRFSMSGASNLNSTAAKQQMDPFLHEGDARWPLISKLMENPTYKRMYVAHFMTILEEQFQSGDYYDVALDLREVIDEAVQADPNKFFSYNNFLDNLDSDINGGGGPGGGATPGVATLMNGRADYLLSISPFTSIAPTIGEVDLSILNPVVGEEIGVSTSIDNATIVFMNYRTSQYAPFEKLQMFDDGAHNDGSAGDGVYGSSILISGTNTEYYIYAENNDAGKFSPQRAQHEFYTILATTNNVSVGDIVINEVLASNDVTAADEAGEYDDWIELYNNSNTEIDITGYTLSDDAESIDKWTFPSETKIAPNGYLIIWADSDEEQGSLHANFKLSASGETVLLADENGTVVDEVVFSEQETDISFGRYSNGTGDFQSMAPTHDSENTNATNTSEESLDYQILVYPNPVNEFVNVYTSKEISLDENIQIYDLHGRLITETDLMSITKVDTRDLKAGIYILKVATKSIKILKL